MATYGVNPLNSKSQNQPIKANFGSKFNFKSNLPSKLNIKSNLPVDTSIFAGTGGVLNRKTAVYRLKNLIERESRVRGSKINAANIRKLFPSLRADKNQYEQYERIINELFPQGSDFKFIEKERDKNKFTKILRDQSVKTRYGSTKDRVRAAKLRHITSKILGREK